MANQFQSKTSGAGSLKDLFEGPVKDQFSEECAVYRAVEKVKKGWSGRNVIRALRVRRNQGIGATSEGGNLPSIGAQTTVAATIGAKYNYLRWGITAAMLKSAQTNEGAFIREGAYSLEMGYKDLKSDVNRQYGWSGNGTLAQLNAAAVAASSITVIGRSGTSEDPDQFLGEGMVIDIVTSAGVIVASAITVNTISVSGTVATLGLSAPVTASSADLIIRSGSLNNEINGLLTSLGTTQTSTIFGVDRSLYRQYQGNVFDASGAQLSLDRMQQAYNAPMKRGGAKLDAIMTDFNGLRMYQKLLTPDKRYVNAVKGDGGFAEKDKFYLDFNGIAVVPDKDFAPNFLFLETGTWKNYILEDMSFADETGSMYIAQSDVDSFEVRVRYWSDLFPEQPSANSRLLGYISP